CSSSSLDFLTSLSKNVCLSILKLSLLSHTSPPQSLSVSLESRLSHARRRLHVSRPSLGSSSPATEATRRVAVARRLLVSGPRRRRVVVDRSPLSEIKVWVKWGERCQFIAQNKLGMTSCHKDLPQTFPGHPWLDTLEGHAALRRVLVVYSLCDSNVGYCQVDLICSSFLF
ncbi:hypothetical protein S83_040129, partial [Arachis hypogaea]